MRRKTITLSARKSAPARKPPARKSKNRAKPSRAKAPARGGTEATIFPPPPGQGKRGEQGYLAYLLRQAVPI